MFTFGLKFNHSAFQQWLVCENFFVVNCDEKLNQEMQYRYVRNLKMIILSTKRKKTKC